MTPETVGEPISVDPAEAVRMAEQLHAAGYINEAVELCRLALGAEPDNPKARHLAKAIAIQVGDFDAAVNLARRSQAATELVTPTPPRFLISEAALARSKSRLPAAAPIPSSGPTKLKFHAEGGEDRYLFEHFFAGKRNGTFLEINANDRVTASQTLFFEQFLSWKGLRTGPVENLTYLLEQHGLATINYCAINDPENAFRIITSLDPSRCQIDILTVVASPAWRDMRTELASKGYDFIISFSDATELYAKAGIQPLRQSTSICAVWSGDPERFELLKAHHANLQAQTRPVHSIYILDDGDDLPFELDATVIRVSRGLSIYEAWNVALAAVTTRYVFNLNLDDRLAPNAVSRMEDALASGGDIVGGDWRICYSQAATDDVTPCSDACDLPFAPDWPPRSGMNTRLGSGTGQRGTLGPSCMWRASLHQELGLFSTAFADGTPVRSIGDAIWWRRLIANGKKLVRLPVIIGNYHSHPDDQAEFRNPAEGEEVLFRQVGLPH